MPERRASPRGSEARPAPDAARALPAGRVGRPHGLDGSFHVTRPRARLLESGMTVAIAGRPHEIVRRAGTAEHPIVRVRGVEDRASAEVLRGAELTVAIADAPALDPGEWWAHELEGCVVESRGRIVGTVRALRELPSCEILEVEISGGRELLVPMVKDAIRAVDVAARRIEIDLDFLGEAPAPDASALEGRERAAREVGDTAREAAPRDEREAGEPDERAPGER